MEQLLTSMHTVSSPNLGTLLIGFLYVFGWAIDFTQVRLVTKVRSWIVFSVDEVVDFALDGSRTDDILTPNGGRECEGEEFHGLCMLWVMFLGDDDVPTIGWFRISFE